MEPTDVSDSKRSEIDREVKRIVDACEKTTRQILKDKRKIMDRVVVDLMEKESLEREEFESIVGISEKEVKAKNEYSVAYE